MSDLMLQAVLRMPPELWGSGAWDAKQRHSRYVQAADELEALRAALNQERAKVKLLTDEVSDLRAFIAAAKKAAKPLSALLLGRGEGGNDG